VNADYAICGLCPRLCRHVCPVAVATGREAATPTAMMSIPLIASQLPELSIEGTSLCMGCGACTRHCKSHQPVAERLSAWRAEHGVLPAPEPLRPIEGAEQLVAILTDHRDWRLEIGRGAMAALRTSDYLGHEAWRAGNPHVIPALSRHLSGRRALCLQGDVAEVLGAAGVPVEWPKLPEKAGFLTCFEGAGTSPDQLACCGRREGFATREPAAARAVAGRNVELWEGAPKSCRDQSCADWLRAAGANIAGPLDRRGESH
jgi:ferredoxin